MLFVIYMKFLVSKQRNRVISNINRAFSPPSIRNIGSSTARLSRAAPIVVSRKKASQNTVSLRPVTAGSIQSRIQRKPQFVSENIMNRISIVKR